VEPFAAILIAQGSHGSVRNLSSGHPRAGKRYLASDRPLPTSYTGSGVCCKFSRQDSPTANAFCTHEESRKHV